MTLTNLHTEKRFRRMRASSYNPTGGNQDYIRVQSGERHPVSLAGPGIIRHIWMTLSGKSVDMYREVELVVRFDGHSKPQIQAPLSDFFLFGHGLLVDVDSEPIQVSRQPHLPEKPYRGGLNCIFPMPFGEEAVVELRNTGDTDVTIFYYIDWEAHDLLQDPVLHFHATLRDEHTVPPEDQEPQKHGSFDSEITNPDWGENYVFLKAENYQGHYVGTGLSIECQPGGAGKWWEGDDMFVIDGEAWPPRLHGTGTEDYFNLAWGFRQVDCRPEYGVTYIDKSPSDTNQIDGRFSMYRFHLNDPIPFAKSLLASIEHGHANDCEAYYRSVAYWYGKPLA